MIASDHKQDKNERLIDLTDGEASHLASKFTEAVRARGLKQQSGKRKGACMHQARQSGENRCHLASSNASWELPVSSKELFQGEKPGKRASKV